MKTLIPLVYSLVFICFSLKSSSQSKEELFNSGIELLENEKYDQAKEYFERIIQIDKKSYDAYFSLGEIYYVQGAFKKAASNFSKTITLLNKVNDSSFLAEAYEARAATYYQMDKLKLSLADCNNSIELKPNSYLPNLLKGKIKHYYSNYNEALVSYNNAIYIDSTIYEAYLDRGELLYDINKEEDAIKDFSTVLSMKPNDAEALYMRGKANSVLDYDSLAINDFLLVDINELSQDERLYYYYYLGYSYFEIGEYRKSIESLNKSIKIDPLSDAYTRLGRCHFELANYGDALHYFLIAIEKSKSNNNYAIMYAALSYIEMEDFDSAKKMLTKVDPNGNYLYFVDNCFGVLYSRLNDEKKALYYFNESILKMKERSFQDWEVYYNRAKLYFKISQFEKGCDDLNIVLRLINVKKQKVNSLKEKNC